MDFWRSYFQRSDHDIWTVIDRAITLAATDYPLELRAKRDAFAEKLFAPLSTSTCGKTSSGRNEESCRNSSEVFQAKNVNVTPDHEYEQVLVDRRSGNRSHSFEEVDALPDKLHEENHVKKEFMHIKKQLLASELDNHQDEESILKLLKRLDTLQASYGALKATEIGKPVNPLRKHSSFQIRSLAKNLVRSWVAIADDWVESLKHVGASPQGHVDDHVGLPTPPMDRGELHAALEMSPDTFELGSTLDLLDDIDERPNGSKRVHPSQSSERPRKQGIETKTQNIHKTTTKEQNNELPMSDVLAAAKRRLHEGYQKIENAKRQRTVQVMELEDLPKGQGPKPARRVTKTSLSRK